MISKSIGCNESGPTKGASALADEVPMLLAVDIMHGWDVIVDLGPFGIAVFHRRLHLHNNLIVT